jgi:hypothetical protein
MGALGGMLILVDYFTAAISSISASPTSRRCGAVLQV